MTSQLRLAWVIAAKDLRLEFKRAYELFAMIVFAAICVIAVSSGFPYLVTETTPYFVAPVLWIIIVFTCILGLSTVFVREYDRGIIDVLRASPIYPQTLFLGKVLYCFALLGIVEVILVPIALIIFNITITSDPLLALVLFVAGTLDFSVAGSLVSGISMYTRSKLLMLPILFFPLIVPALIPLIAATKFLILGQTIARELSIIGLHLFTTILIAFLVVEYVIEA